MANQRSGGLLGDLLNMRKEALEESARLYVAIQKLEPIFATWNKKIDENTKAVNRLAKAIEKQK